MICTKLLRVYKDTGSARELYYEWNGKWNVEENDSNSRVQIDYKQVYIIAKMLYLSNGREWACCSICATIYILLSIFVNRCWSGSSADLSINFVFCCFFIVTILADCLWNKWTTSSNYKTLYSSRTLKFCKIMYIITSLIFVTEVAVDV